MAWNRLRFARTTEALRATTIYMLGEPIIPTDGANANRLFLGNGSTAGGRALAFKDEVSGTAPGAVIGSAYAQYTANADITTPIPIDDTIPQNTEGTQILTVTLTPSSTMSKVRVRFQAWATHTAVQNVIAALFVGTAADAVRADVKTVPIASGNVGLGFEFEHTPGITTPVTYAIRVGPFNGTMRLNGSPSGRNFGGAAAATLVAEEIKG